MCKNDNFVVFYGGLGAGLGLAVLQEIVKACNSPYFPKCSTISLRLKIYCLNCCNLKRNQLTV